MYSRNYGSLGAVVVLLLWFYLSGAAILIGGKINAEIENAAAKRGAPDAKLRGEKEPGALAVGGQWLVVSGQWFSRSVVSDRPTSLFIVHCPFSTFD